MTDFIPGKEVGGASFIELGEKKSPEKISSEEFETMWKKKYEDNWSNVQNDCMLCEMEKKTKWYIETPDFVVAEKLGGGPFIVSKTHQKELSDEESEKMRHLVELLFGKDAETRVIMGMCPNHYHAHIIADDLDVDLSHE